MKKNTRPHTLIIAEAGVNHNGSIENAKKLIAAAASAGADVVKFQTFNSKNLVSKHALMADYQKKNLNKETTQYEMLKKLELSEEDHFVLKKYAQSKKIEFLSTAFDIESLKFLVSKVGIKRIKVSSGEITNAPLLLEMGRTKLPFIISTGMADLGEIRTALGFLAWGALVPKKFPKISQLNSFLKESRTIKYLKSNATILHCTTEYPAPFSELNLNCITSLKKQYALPVGYSDHSLGIEAPIAAVCLEATVIEKHFTLDKNLEGPDHKASLEPFELKQMVSAIRNLEVSFGDGIKKPTASEIKNKAVARKSLVASENIKKGDYFTLDNLTTKRPGSGISAIHFGNYLGKKSKHSYSKDDLINE
jgi:N-acetylneuraminate synthase